MKIRYIVEKNCKTVKVFDEEMAAIIYSKQIGGVAWRQAISYEKSGLPCNEFWRYDGREWRK